MSKVLSIEVGYSLTKICEMDFRSKQPKVYNYFSIPTPNGVYDDGFLNEDADFYQAIKSVLTANKIKTKQAVCTITSTKIATREVMIPAIKSNQIAALIEANAKDYFPIDLSEYEIGHLVLGYNKDVDGSQKLKCMVMACSKQLISCYEKLTAACGLHLISVDYSGNSVYQIMKGEVKEDTEMVIRVEERSSVASIISNHNLVMQRTFAYGVENAILALVNSTAYPQKNFADALEEMKRITCIRFALNENTVMIEKEDDIQYSAKVMEAMKDITENLAPLVGNIARVLDLYNSKNPDSPVKKVVLIGMGSDISGLSKLFTNELQVKSVIAENIHSIAWNNSIGVGTSGRYVTAVGAGIAPIGFINEEKKTNDLKDVNYRNVTILIAVLCILVCAFFYFKGYTKYQTQLKEQKRLEALQAQYEPYQAVAEQYNNLKEFYALTKIGYYLTEAPNDNLLTFLEEMEKILPKTVEITEFQSNSEAALISIVATNYEEASKIIQNMRKLTCAMDVTVTGLEEVKDTTEVEEGKEGEKKEEKKETAEKTEEEKATVDTEKAEGEIENEEFPVKITLSVVYFPNKATVDDVGDAERAKELIFADDEEENEEEEVNE